MMGSARSYECPSCGGLVREQARICGYCQSPIATVRCSLCFSMNVPEARFCLACGSELGLEPVAVRDLGALSCPRCVYQSLDGFSNGDGLLYDCGHCGGQFVDQPTLQVMVRRHQGLSVSAIPPKPRPLKWNPKATYIPCPVCKALMTRRNFGRTSGIIVDVCSIHGTWFDVGELPNILWFVASGGLARAEELANTERVRLSRVREAVHGFGLQRAEEEDGVIALSEMADAVKWFVEWVVGSVVNRR